MEIEVLGRLLKVNTFLAPATRRKETSQGKRKEKEKGGTSTDSIKHKTLQAADDPLL